MENYKLIHSEKNFDVVEVEGLVGIKSKSMTVAVMPYTVDDKGLIENVGFLKEFNPFRIGGFADTLITGTVETEDENLLDTVIRELKEEGGIEVPNEQRSRVIFLGAVYPYKDSDRMIPIFAVDVTSLVMAEPEGDGSKKESQSEFLMVLS